MDVAISALMSTPEAWVGYLLDPSTHYPNHPIEGRMLCVAFIQNEQGINLVHA